MRPILIRCSTCLGLVTAIAAAQHTTPQSNTRMSLQDQLLEHLRNSDAAPVADDLAARCKPAWRLSLTEAESDDAIPVGASKFGGSPDLPPKHEWPRSPRRAFMTFIAQIDLAEAARIAGPIDGVPPEGLLSIFLDIEPDFEFEELSARQHVRVFLFADSDDALVRTPRPNEPPGNDKFLNKTLGTRLLAFERMISGPPFDQVADLDDIDDCFDTVFDLNHRGYPSEPLGAKRIQMGGWPAEHQEGALPTAAAGWLEIDTSRIESFDPEWKRIREEAKHWTPVFQFDPFEFGARLAVHGTRIYICIRDGANAAPGLIDATVVEDID